MVALGSTSQTYLVANLHYVNEPLVNMREHPSHASKIVSQALFAEEVTICEKKNAWSLIKTSEGYSGWVFNDGIVSRQDVYSHQIMTSRLNATIYKEKDIEYGPMKILPYGSKLNRIDMEDPRWYKVVLPDNCEGYIQKGDAGLEPPLVSQAELVYFSQKFLGIPYIWGGRSSFGYDCSGFVQMLYNQMGILLPRDSKEQIQDPRFKDIPLNTIEAGDLIFFGKSREKIMHVGLFLGNNQFIHTSIRENMPWVRISRLSDFEWSGHVDAYYPFRAARQLVSTR